MIDNDSGARFFLGKPYRFNDICSVFPPTINDVCTDEFPQYKAMLTLSQEDLEDIFQKEVENDPSFEVPTPFDFFLGNCYHSKDYRKMAYKTFRFFCHEKIEILFDLKTIVMGDLEKQVEIARSTDDLRDNLRMITEDDFFEFQNLIRQACGEKPAAPPDPDEDPRIKRIKAKGRYRDKIAAKKNGTSLETLLSSICCMGLGLTPLNIGEISYAAAIKLVDRYQAKEKYELDVSSLLAGADSKTVKPKYWIRNDSD